MHGSTLVGEMEKQEAGMCPIGDGGVPQDPGREQTEHVNGTEEFKEAVYKARRGVREATRVG